MSQHPLYHSPSVYSSQMKCVSCHRPDAIKIYPTGFVTYRPMSGSFSKIIKIVASAMNAKFIVPPTKAKAISAQQHPKHTNPSRTPLRNGPSAKCCMKNVSGARHLDKQASFKFEN